MVITGSIVNSMQTIAEERGTNLGIDTQTGVTMLTNNNVCIIWSDHPKLRYVCMIKLYIVHYFSDIMAQGKLSVLL